MSRINRTAAFEAYAAMGPQRSYQAVAEQLDVSKRAITRIATRDRWQARLADVESSAHDRAAQRAAESLEEMNTRHLRSLKAIQRKALETLSAMSLESAMDAVRALDLSIKHERTIRGEPSERTAISVEDAIRREHERWLVDVEHEPEHEHEHAHEHEHQEDTDADPT